MRIFPGRVQDLRTVASAGFCLSHWLLIRDIHIFYCSFPQVFHIVIYKKGGFTHLKVLFNSFGKCYNNHTYKMSEQFDKRDKIESGITS